MELENIQNQIRAIDDEIKYLNSQKKKLEGQIEEAEQALASAKKARKEFDSFVSKRRAAKEKPTKKSALKAFASFLNKANEMLAGNEYSVANGKVSELTTVVNNKIKVYSDDLDYCKKEIRRLKNQKETLVSDYNALLDKQNEGGDE